MNLVARAKAILMTPKQEWAAIDAEPLNVSELLIGYVLPLAAIGPIARFMGSRFSGSADSGCRWDGESLRRLHRSSWA